MPNFWRNELEARRAGLRPHFVGAGESLEDYRARMAPIAQAEETEAQEFAAFRAQRAAQLAAEAQAAAAQAETPGQVTGA